MDVTLLSLYIVLSTYYHYICCILIDDTCLKKLHGRQNALRTQQLLG